MSIDGYIGPIAVQPAPAAPTTMSLDFDISSRTLYLQWNQNTESYFSHYIVERADSLEQTNWTYTTWTVGSWDTWKVLSQDLTNAAYNSDIQMIRYKDTGVELFNQRGMYYKYRVSSVAYSYASSSYAEYPSIIKLGVRGVLQGDVPNAPIIRNKNSIVWRDSDGYWHTPKYSPGGSTPSNPNTF